MVHVIGSIPHTFLGHYVTDGDNSLCCCYEHTVYEAFLLFLITDMATEINFEVKSNCFLAVEI